MPRPPQRAAPYATASFVADGVGRFLIRLILSKRWTKSSWRAVLWCRNGGGASHGGERRRWEWSVRSDIRPRRIAWPPVSRYERSNPICNDDLDPPGRERARGTGPGRHRRGLARGTAPHRLPLS